MSQPERRGRGKSRGGLGKYLRARGRGRGLGRPAEFGKRLLLDGEGNDEDHADALDDGKTYSNRPLATNADRYVEPEPELGSDVPASVESCVDIDHFVDGQVKKFWSRK